ncbi:NAD(P)H-quinone oxidoreductase [Natronoglycomyces albus]|uniref:NAD(P)H-quinone oxidoreductase n=1 Tax=Natronoglycomyces albus TaxID=2811108 RepID=A0A895XDZ3_9ACTN|nr:NAD(P)H-quinone oxidoreductase [Natronoglycomyces albus]QSB04031.1 NAD(P)H-quinone oxidoreductase [Natronoglycomyces albus]
MRAVVIEAPGGPETLVEADLPDPTPGPEEVVIDIAAVGVNRADLLQRAGHYPPPKGAPAWPGLECSGRISALGDDVTSWELGEEVCALLPGGGYADKVAVHYGLLMAVPDGVDLIDAAALPEAAATVWSNLVDVGEIEEELTVLIHGGAGGIGTFAVQFAKAVDAVVYTTARESNHDGLLELGADVVIDYENEDFVAVLKEAGGADIILDNLGGGYLDRNIAALAPYGQLITIGLQKGRTGEIDMARLMAKRAQITGSTLRSRSLLSRIQILSGVEDDMWPLVEEDEIIMPIHARLPLAEAAQAHRLMEAGGHFGKILLVADEDL